MIRSHKVLVLASLFAAIGCNALLGTDPSTSSPPGADDELDAGDSEAEGDDDDDTTGTKKPDASKPRDASTSNAKMLPLECGDMSGYQAGAPWPTGGACNRRISRAAVSPLVKPKIKWRYTLPDVSSSAEFTSGAVLGANDTIYATFTGAVDGGIASDLVGIKSMGNSGKLLFKTRLPGPSISTPAVGADGTIYVASAAGVSAVTPAGIVSWTYPMAGARYTSPAVLPDGTIVAAGTELVAIYPNGTKRWNLPSLGRSFSMSVAVTKTGLLAASELPVAGTLPGWISIVSPEGARGKSVTLKSGSEYTPLVAADGTIVAASTFGVVAFNENADIKYQAAQGVSGDQAFMTDAPPFVWFGGVGTDFSLLGFNLSKGGVEKTKFGHGDYVAAAGDGSLVSIRRDYPDILVTGMDPDGKERWSVPLEQGPADVRPLALDANGSVVAAFGPTVYVIGD